MRAIPAGPSVLLLSLLLLMFLFFGNYIHRLTPRARKKCAANGHREMHRFCLAGPRTNDRPLQGFPDGVALSVRLSLRGAEVQARIRMQNDNSEGQCPSPLSRVNRLLARLPCSSSPCLDKQQGECEKQDLDAHRASSMGCTRRCRDRRMPVHTAVLHGL